MEGQLTMGAVTNIFRRGAVYYYRRSIRSPDGQICRICLSLRTRRLEVARRRGAALAVALDELRTRLAMFIRRQGLTAKQRERMEGCQAIIECDTLPKLHAAIYLTPNGNGCIDRPIEFLDLLAAMEKVCGEWAVYGWPQPGEDDSLEQYLLDRFDDSLSESDRIELCGGLRFSVKYVDRMLNASGRSAVRAVGGDDDDLARTEAIYLMLSVKFRYLGEFRQHLEHPEIPWPVLHLPDDLLLSRSKSAIPVYPEFGSRHLVNLYHGSGNGTAAPQSSTPASVAVHGKAFPVADVPSELKGSNSELVDRYCLEVMKCGTKRALWGPKTESQFRSTMMLMDKHVRPRSLSDVKARDFGDLSLMFNRLPVHHHKSPADKDKSLEQIADEAAKKLADGKLSEEDVGLDRNTTNRHFTFLKRFYRWLSKPIYDSVNWGDLIDRDDRNKRDLREAFTISHGTKIFSLPIWTGCRSETSFLTPGENIYHGSGYWVPLLLWYGGCRREEVCGLLLDEIVSDHGIPCLKIQSNTLRRVERGR